jgi:heptosyltransferase-3
VYEHRKDAKRHEVEYNLNLLRSIDCEPKGEPAFAIHLSAEVDRHVRHLCASAGVDLNRKFAVIHPGSGGSARDWRAEHFGRLAALLSGELHMQAVVTGTAAEAYLGQKVVESSNGSAIGLAGMFSLKELAAFIRLARIFVANSTGPLHIAAVVGTPVIGLYPQHTAMSVRRWGPWTNSKRVLVPSKPIDCRECEGGGEGCACMDSITVEHVFEEAKHLLDQVARVKAS